MYIELVGPETYIIIDTIANLNSMYRTISNFLSSDKSDLILDTKQDRAIFGESIEMLCARLVIRKEGSQITVSVSEDRSFIITGPTNLLVPFLEAFRFEVDEDGGHHHPDIALCPEECEELFSPESLMFYIEADNSLNDKGQSCRS